MKRRYFSKVTFAYLVFCASIFIIICTFTQSMISNYMIRVEASDMYRISYALASDYIAEAYSPDYRELTDQMQLLSQYMGADIWLVGSDTSIKVCTDNYTSADMDAFGEDGTLTGYSNTYFNDEHYMTGYFYNTLDTECLTVCAEVMVSESTSICILAHKPLTSVTAQANSFLNIYFYTAALTFLIAFVIVVIFTRVLYMPLYKIIDGTKNYAKGDFSTPINVHAKDEVGYLADTINYMASTISTREEDQRNFISNVSHDFRSPLTSIKGYVEAMLDGTIPPEFQEKYLNIILFETQRLQKLTENLLQLNQYGSAGMMINRTTFDINRLIEEILPTFEGACQQKSLRFSILTKDELFVSADRDKIAQVLYNLIDNAVKFSYSGTDIVLRTSSSGSKARISVRDKGIGIPTESIPKIWDRFYKTDLSRGKDRRGSGLGLAIIKEIIQAHNENITVVSTVGAGTEFLFTLPLAQQKEAL
ncbi:MAG: HAMP domain-containing histidine kinase [Clostridiales bacterium]|nr:HAMP domain-containing histidine kinase [Clostridiales bacterium]